MKQYIVHLGFLTLLFVTNVSSTDISDNKESAETEKVEISPNSGASKKRKGSDSEPNNPAKRAKIGMSNTTGDVEVTLGFPDEKAIIGLQRVINFSVHDNNHDQARPRSIIITPVSTELSEKLVVCDAKKTNHNRVINVGNLVLKSGGGSATVTFYCKGKEISKGNEETCRQKARKKVKLKVTMKFEGSNEEIVAYSVPFELVANRRAGASKPKGSPINPNFPPPLLVPRNLPSPNILNPSASTPVVVDVQASDKTGGTSNSGAVPKTASNNKHKLDYILNGDQGQRSEKL